MQLIKGGYPPRPPPGALPGSSMCGLYIVVLVNPPYRSYLSLLEWLIRTASFYEERSTIKPECGYVELSHPGFTRLI